MRTIIAKAKTTTNDWLFNDIFTLDKLSDELKT